MAQPIWNTISGTIGSFVSGSTIVPIQLYAIPVSPATTVSYAIISGQLPENLKMTSAGLIYGVTASVLENTTTTFVVRATDNLGNINDRTFSIFVSGIDAPEFTTVDGSILSTPDSVWTELQIGYTTPIPDSPVVVRLVQGQLPPGLEINEYGLIRGYPKPPFFTTNTGLVVTAAIATLNNTVVCYSTAGFTKNRPVVFTGSTLGGIVAGVTYYIESIIDISTFTISTSPNGSVFSLSNEVGFMTVTLPDISVGQPTIRTYNFTLKLESSYGTDLGSYSITVVNQNLPTSAGGPGKPANSRSPTTLNTRPLTYDIRDDDINYTYYSLPPDGKGATYPLNVNVPIGSFTDENLFGFRILGYDFDGDDLEYVFSGLPSWLTGDTVTGWVTGTPDIAIESISQFEFTAYARKVRNNTITSDAVSYIFKISDQISPDVVWISGSDLGSINNNTESMLYVKAIADLDLEYELISGSLPANLQLLTNGEIVGTVAFQPTTDLLSQGDTSSFEFTVKAYSPDYPVVSSNKTFTLTVYQQFANPMDTVYIKCTPSIDDRELLADLLNDTSLIPDEYLYRPLDPNFGKAQSIVYNHIYGVNASNFDAYVAAVTKNHYWRNITLGEIQTAVARNQNTGEIVYEVVYSFVYDNLINYDSDKYITNSQTNLVSPQGESISKEIYWPRPIPLFLGPWYTTETDIYTSYENAPSGQEFYTSLTPGEARILYPDSLPNMREQVVDVLGQEENTNILPLWMTSQQLNGSSTGFVPAWVICYTKPGYSETVKNNIVNNWKTPAGTPLSLNMINFKIDRFTVNKSLSYDYDNNLNPPAWIGLPSATPTPDPIYAKDFYVWFPQQTILPDNTQY